MHIKQVIVCGFRSYKDQVAVAPFSNQHNVVIGRNGTGKSNFFDAIRFGLLTSRFANLRPDERQALLHEGSGKHVMSAYVEIVFDNSDGRLPVDDTEVTLRRTIGVKKDEFFLNRKHITKSDVVHLLESAGFSRSNPYYIVQQGKVNALAVMRERERLELLKEVAGTKVYEDQRVKSLKILQDTQMQRDKIQEVVSYIEERLAELEEEKKELKEYQQLDREQRALEYTMHEKELQNVQAEIEALEKQRQEEGTRSTELHEKLMQVRAEISRIESYHQRKEQDLAQLVEERESQEEERKGLMEARYKLEMEVRELKEQIRSDGVQRSAVSKEVDVVKREIEAKQAQLNNEILPALRKAGQTHDQVARNLQECRAQSEHLIAKQSRKSQFRTQQERDDYLQREISDIESLVRRKEGDTGLLRDSIEGLANSIDGSDRTLKQQTEELREHRRRVDAVGAQVLRLKEQRNFLSEERKGKWREENQASYELRELKKKVSDGEHALQSTMFYDVRRGLQAVREMQDRIRGVFGPLIDLVRPVDERYCIAADEAAGGALFHVVVDTDDTATRIMRELDKKNLGRLTFLPLNRLKVKDHFDYPRNDDVVALVEKLEYPAEIRRAVMAAFGKKLLCRDLDTCVRYAEQTNMDCLTLEGDMVHRRGALNGGFKDPRRSRTRAMMEVKQAQVDLERVAERARRVTAEAQQADQRVTGIISEIQKLEAEKHRAITAHERLCDEISRRKNHIRTERDNLAQRERSCELQEREVKDLVAKAMALRSELLTSMQDSLTADEHQLLHSLSAKISLFEAEERDQRQRLEEIRSEKESINTVLEENLIRRENELARQLGEGVEELATSEREENLKAKQIDLGDASRLVDDNSSLLKDLEQKIEALQQGITNENALVDTLNGEDVSLSDEIQQEARGTEKILNKHRRLLKKREDATRDIRELGTLPIAELEKFKELPYSDVIKQFKRRNEKLKKYSHVNKKALDQFVSFNEQRATLLERKQEIDDAYNSIKDLIDVLDKRKDEAIFRTFKGVASFFSEVFRELVPTGEGKMILVGADTSQSGKTNGKDVSLESNVGAYSGVQIKVNFRGEGDSYLMQQLSGGQKALVALAFIFAIQRVDPAPFYLFDEIDQALDSTHRAAVAALIHRQAHSKDSSAQFITSTFRPELVNIADKFYGIGHQNKISNVYPMTKEESLDFISDIMTEEEGVAGT
ncbi:chromosome segregation protein, putative [Phytophthora infestans T30-4]|uniref:Structural maintenance of chromosomes protein n=2 Tax=Phytophthora infestans TaxID=4787 RepID=D0NY27_PHYIT|nr:chromosome segregation protein, putative [Phytophthora infestans T30-4]EEY67985.1 chromosome segregation protein, putative [Phytophthora infestans T30-4]KAF4139950.1 SMC proteins Flexible Hinge Domain [Phytophthora infestans]|eukprot:XP_002997684.1 chromosome segregation protein, putative [Phytophthora infestans T30-4]